MSIQSEIERLVEAKNDIATSIENKGVTVPSNTLLSGMPSLIDQITGDVTSVNGQTGDVVLSAIDVGALASDVTYVESINGSSGTVQIAIPSNLSDLNNDSGFITGMTILSYGSSTWDDFLTAYNANKVVYCRASSNSNPATGNQTRMAFMAYVNANPPTNVEFQYYRSVNSHSATQQGDQVYVYKLDKSAGWSVTVRENYTKIVAGTGLSSAYSNGVLTLSNSNPLPTVSSSDNDKVLKVVSGAWAAVTDSGGGSINFVTFTANKNPYSVTADKTFQEVKTGIDNGELWFAIVKGDYFTQSGSYNFPLGSPVVFELNNCSSSTITFSTITAQATASTQTLIHNRVSIQSDGTYGSSVSQMGIAKPTYLHQNYLILQTDAEGYPDPPTGTLSLANGGSVPTLLVLYDALFGGAEGDKVIRLIYYLGEEDYEIYQLTEAKQEYNNLDDKTEYTAVFKTLGSRNGTPLIKTITVHGTSDAYDDAYVEDATVTYSETALQVSVPSASGVSF